MIKFLHTRVRVADLQKSIDFYCKHCGFEVFKGPKTSPQGNQVVHLKLPGNEHTLEFTYSPDFKVEFPEDLMHTAIGVDDIHAFCQKLEDDGVEIWPGNWKEKENFAMAFITDPDGYEIEILPNKR